MSDLTDSLHPQPAGESDPTLLSAFGNDATGNGIGGERDPLDRLAEEFADRARRGESPSISEYEARFPDQAEKIRKLLGAVAMMEQLRRGSKQARFLPERIGEFRVLRELGRGGMGVVYEAVQESLWRHVAVKAIHHTQLDSKRLQRFQREAQAVAQLHHTNIVPIFGVGEHDGVPYYAMQYIKGRGLDAVLESWRNGSPPAPERRRQAARFALQAAEALAYAHDQGVLHRDIKPANLLIDEHDAVWVTDFGLAKLVGHEELTASGDVIGTLRYLAPESLRGISEARSDVYSLGLTLYEMITLNPPFGDLTPSELLHRVSEGQPVRPRQVDPTIPRDLETIVLKATARDLKDRYASAGALAVDLQRFLDDRPILARRAGLVERGWRWSRRNRTVAALSALAAASLVLATVVGWVGYVRTNEALRRESVNLVAATKNVTFLNKLFEEIFDKLSPEDQLEADAEIPLTRQLSPDAHARLGDPLTFANGIEPTNAGRGPGHPGAFGPPHGRDDFRPLDRDFGGPRHLGPDGRPDPRHENARDKALSLLESVLASYDQFAQNNKANAQVQSEAAWVYYKMGTLNERLGRREQADQAFNRTLAIFDELSSHNPQQPAYFKRFFRVCAALNPWQTDPAKLGAIERRLRGMETSIGRLVAASPGNPDYLRGQVQLLAKLGLVHHKQGRPDAEASFRRALELASILVEREPEKASPHSDRSDVLEAYALVLADGGNIVKAREFLEAAMQDLEWVAADGLRSLLLAIRMESLADDFERIGDQRRADQIQERADQVDPRPPLPNRPKPGQPFGPQRPGGDPSRDDSPTG